MGRWVKWTTAEPHGTPVGWNYDLKSNFSSVFCRFRSPRPPLPQYLTFRWLRNAWYWSEGGIRERGERKMGRWAQWTTAEPRGTPIGGGFRPQTRLVIGVFQLSLFSCPHFLLPPHRNRRFGGFEAPRIGREGGIWERGERIIGRWAQWAADRLR